MIERILKDDLLKKFFISAFVLFVSSVYVLGKENKNIYIYMSILLPISAWLFLYWGSAIVSDYLYGKIKLYFNVFISVLMSIVFGLFIYDEAAMFNLWNAFFSLSYLIFIPIVILFFMGSAAGENYEGNRIYKLYIISSLAIFILCTISSPHGICNNDNEHMVAIKNDMLVGKYFIYYVCYVLSAYAGITFGLIRNADDRINKKN